MPAHSALEASEVQQPMPSALDHLPTQGQPLLDVLASLEQHGNWLFPSTLCRASALLLLPWSCSTSCGWLLIPSGISFPREHIATVPAQTCPFVLSHFPGRSGQMDAGVAWGCGLSHATPIAFILHFCLGQHDWLCLLQGVAACFEPQPAPHPQELLQSLPTWRCSPFSSDKISQGSPELSVSV